MSRPRAVVVVAAASGIVASTLFPACGGAAEPSPVSAAFDAGPDASDGTTPDWGALCVAPWTRVEEGWTDDYYVVKNFRFEGAPSGEYRLFGVHPEPPLQIVTLHLAHDCAEVATLDYFWSTEIRSEGEGTGHELVFPGWFRFEVFKRSGGSINLYHLPESLFDGTHVVVVQ